MREVEEKPCITVEELVNEVSRKVGVPREYVAYELMMLWKKGAVELEGYPMDNRIMYLLSIEGLWYWVTLGISLASVLAVLLIGNGPLMYIRYVLGALMTLFMPGYSLIETLYPRGDELKPLERLALSIGLSLAITPLIGLILNYTPWGIRLIPIMVSTTLATTALLTTAAIKKSNYYLSRRSRCFE
ncbi:membrane protein-like protein [Caldivirga maquilingensis IC-167]|uniref:Membrane protein-like protein n=2 Tax=Caldivirga maquilingensis TaxID=76887 RepID=A8M971_CALMQ|nr:membrane protein-like protein [Caldivirga maquilingensis IC-167]